ncbi:hypothetical protein MC7420_4060 [Coleofasciculus chthonoplastes PCC 7420]|uniref:Uncharacterized protein n=1 Tax=Coleofasciculus chthonoplastes PCC 7420 TaxID=118168 RepID=B4VUY1_9CYAN|nr:hypothetical protein MC7420_4060 [Coleofasciculus chthonoplastes PCC 7420]
MTGDNFDHNGSLCRLETGYQVSPPFLTSYHAISLTPGNPVSILVMRMTNVPHQMG